MQDLIFAIGAIFFIIALIPSIRGDDKPALFTSLTTGGWLLAFAITYTTFDHPLWYAAITTFGGSVCWFILAYQKWRQPSVIILAPPTPAIDAVTRDYVDRQAFSNAGFVTVN